MSVMALDSGNSIIKAKIARQQNGEIAFPHAMKQLTESEYKKSPTGLDFKINRLIIYGSTGSPTWLGRVLSDMV